MIHILLHEISFSRDDHIFCGSFAGIWDPGEGKINKDVAVVEKPTSFVGSKLYSTIGDKFLLRRWQHHLAKLYLVQPVVASILPADLLLMRATRRSYSFFILMTN